MQFVQTSHILAEEIAQCRGCKLHELYSDFLMSVEHFKRDKGAYDNAITLWSVHGLIVDLFESFCFLLVKNELPKNSATFVMKAAA
jgi:hypothetical protein